MFPHKIRSIILNNTIAMLLVCAFSISDVSWALPSYSSRLERNTLAAGSRFKSFFEKHDLDFKSEAALLYAAGSLKEMLLDRGISDDVEIRREINRLNRLFPDNAVTIDEKMGERVFGNRMYRTAVFNFPGHDKSFDLLFVNDHKQLTTGELNELGIKSEEKHNFDSPGLEGVWFIERATAPASASSAIASRPESGAIGNDRRANFVTPNMSYTPDSQRPGPGLSIAELCRQLDDFTWGPSFLKTRTEVVNLIENINLKIRSSDDVDSADKDALEIIRKARENTAARRVETSLNETERALKANGGKETYKMFRGIGDYNDELHDIKIIEDIVGRYNYLVEKGVLRRGEPMRILDIGCGQANFLMELLNNKRLKEEGIVIEPYGLGLRELEEWKDRSTDIRLTAGIAENMPAEWSGKFHYIVSVRALEYSPDQLRFIEEAHRVLSPCGKAVIQSPNDIPGEGAPYWEVIFGRQHLLGGHRIYTDSYYLPIITVEKGAQEPPLLFPYELTGPRAYRPLDVSAAKAAVPVKSGAFTEYSFGVPFIEFSLTEPSANPWKYKVKEGYKVGSEIYPREPADFLPIIESVIREDSKFFEDTFRNLFAKDIEKSSVEKIRVAFLQKGGIKYAFTVRVTLKDGGEFVFSIKTTYPWLHPDDRTNLINSTHSWERSGKMASQYVSALGARTTVYVKDFYSEIIIMSQEYVYGPMLMDILNKDGVPFGLKVKAAKDAVTCYMEAHAKYGIPIWDPKPDNICLEHGTERDWKLIDLDKIYTGSEYEQRPVRNREEYMELLSNFYDIYLDFSADGLPPNDFGMVIGKDFDMKDKKEKARKAIVAIASRNKMKESVVEDAERLTDQLMTRMFDEKPNGTFAIRTVKEKAGEIGVKLTCRSYKAEIKNPEEFAGDIVADHVTIESSGRRWERKSSGALEDAGQSTVIVGSRISVVKTLSHGTGLPAREAIDLSSRIHEYNRNNPPAISEKTILCHIIIDSILPPEQWNMLSALEQDMNDNSYVEKVCHISAGDSSTFIDILRTEIAILKNKYAELHEGYNVEFYIACPSTGHVNEILNSGLKAKALAFEPCKESAQVEGIILALRALHSGQIERLKSVYRFLTGKEPITNTDDIDEFARLVTITLPTMQVLDNELRRLNKTISDNIRSAA